LAGAAERPELALVHVEANVGGASGGHTALRLGDDVYHYQQRDERLLLVREDWQLFRFGYNVLQNRPLHVAHVPLDREVWGALRDHFAAAYLEQQRALGELWSARLDVELLEAWRGEGEGFHARAAGLLDPEQPGAVDGVALRRRLEARLGAGFASAEIAALEPGLFAPPEGAAATQRQRDALVLRAALLADASGRQWRHRALAERAVLGAWAGRLEEAIVALLRSPRPDRGRALLVATARHRAVLRSLGASRLWLLGVLSDGAEALGAREVRARRAEIAAVAEGGRFRRALALTWRLDERRVHRLEVCRRKITDTVSATHRGTAACWCRRRACSARRRARMGSPALISARRR
jgi:hypothetical protein